jgi:hypothetical protein
MKEGVEPSKPNFHFFQLHVPVQLPCYDFIQITNFSMDLTLKPSSKTDSLHVTGGVYKANLHVHRNVLICDY